MIWHRRSVWAGRSLLLLCLIAGCARQPATLRQELLATAGSVRPVAGRLASGFLYAPIGQNRVDPSRRRKLARLTHKVLARLEKARSPGALADGALVDLLLQSPAAAVAKLEEAIAVQPRWPDLRCDLAAAYLARSETSRQPADLGLALAAADRALAANSTLAPALFNRALALERLFLLEDAEAAWSRYLKVDPASPWADEARHHFELLGQAGPTDLWRRWRDELRPAALAGDQAFLRQVVSRFPQPVREKVEEDLLPAWGEAFLHRDIPGAESALTTARALAESLSSTNGDRLLADAVAAIGRVQMAGDTQRLTALARGHQIYGRARPLVNRHQIDDAEPLLLSARRDLEWAGSPFAAWARLQLASCRIERSDNRAALALLKGLRVEFDLGHYPSLRGRVEWLTALIQLGGTDPAAGLASYHRALEAFRSLGERENLSTIESLLGEALTYLGEGTAAWTYRYSGLSALPEVFNPRRRAGRFEEAQRALETEGQEAAALYFSRQAARAAQQLGDPVSVSNALLRSAQLSYRLGDLAGARRDLAAARRQAEAAEKGQRERSVAAVDVAAGEIEPPEQARRFLLRALEFYRRAENHYPLVSIHLALGRLEIRSGALALGEADLDAAINEYERQRTALAGNPQQQDVYFAQSRSLFDTMIELQAVTFHRPQQAFGYAERGRVRARLDEKGENHSGSAPTTQATLAALPSRGAFIEYAVLPERTLAWVLRRGSLVSFELAAGRERLASLTGQLQWALAARDTASAEQAAAQLYDLLVKPLTGALTAGEPLTIVPDKELHSIPFALLRDRRKGRFLIEDHALTVSPSVAVHLACRERARVLAAAGTDSSALIAGAPAFDQTIFPSLESLPAAETEARQVAALYPRPKLLLGQDATKVRFMAEIEGHAVVHFAGHSLVHPSEPLLSQLALAPSPGDSGSLRALDLYRLRPVHTRLVVLSACESGSRQTRGAEGVTGLASHFLALGIPTVVASLWSVADRPTALLMASFHRHFRGGEDATDALRSAQLELLRHSDPVLRSPASWGAFAVFGDGAAP
jgi:CHAT domain-containing protein